MKKQSESTESLNKIQKYYIAHHQSRDIKTLSKDVGASVKIVRSYLTTIKERAAKKEAEAQKEEANKPPDPGIKGTTIDEFMVKNKKRGVTIMTETASQLSDDARKRSMPSRLSQNVQKVRPE